MTPLPTGPRVPRQRPQAMKAYLADHPTPLSPCIDQILEEVAGYYRSAPLGASAVVRETQYGLLRYHVAKIVGSKPECGRVYVSNFGAFYMKSGKNCFHPTGQTQLVVPTEKVLAWIIEHPSGQPGVAIYRHDGE